MIVWMLYSAVVALIIAAAARAAEWLGRLAGYRIRWIWVGALALTTFLSASAALRGAGLVPRPELGSPLAHPGDIASATVGVSWRQALDARLAALRRSLDAPVGEAALVVRRSVSPAAERYAASLAVLTSVALIVVLLSVGRRFRRARREWPLVTIEGVAVRMSPRVGPAVIGIVHPEIVVPRWLLARPADEQRLVVAHEREHVVSRDPLLLGFAWCAVIVAPWNPAVWYMFSRLRLAVELDCDARVLRRGAVPQAYGSLLIDVAQRASVLRLSALALADDSSHLHQRLLAMRPIVPRLARLRAALASVVALSGILVACQSTLPTRAETDQPDVPTETGEAVKSTPATTTVAPAVTNARMAPAAAATPAPARTVVTRTPLAAVASADTVARLGTVLEKKLESPSPMIFIDGVRATMSEVKALPLERIESVEVVKGALAKLHYNDPLAEFGVITITTKRGSTH